MTSKPRNTGRFIIVESAVIQNFVPDYLLVKLQNLKLHKYFCMANVLLFRHSTKNAKTAVEYFLKLIAIHCFKILYDMKLVFHGLSKFVHLSCCYY
jgi:hypothetical protein